MWSGKMIPNINEIRQSSISIEKINECKHITETQKSIDKLVNECKKRAEIGYGYLHLVLFFTFFEVLILATLRRTNAARPGCH